MNLFTGNSPYYHLLKHPVYSSACGIGFLWVKYITGTNATTIYCHYGYTHDQLADKENIIFLYLNESVLDCTAPWILSLVWTPLFRHSEEFLIVSWLKRDSRCSVNEICCTCSTSTVAALRFWTEIYRTASYPSVFLYLGHPEPSS